MFSFSHSSFLSPLQLVKTADLDPKHNYVLGFHPHGVLVAGAFTNFCTYATGFRQLFPGLTSYLLMLPLWFRAPFFRDYIMCAGVGPRRLNPTENILYFIGFKVTSCFLLRLCRSDSFGQRERQVSAQPKGRWARCCDSGRRGP